MLMPMVQATIFVGVKWIYFVFVFLPKNDDRMPNWLTLFDTYPTYTQMLRLHKVVPPQLSVYLETIFNHSKFDKSTSIITVSSNI